MICLGCMRQIDSIENACPYCGFSVAEYIRKTSKRVLSLKTILAGRYLVGKVLGEGGFGITYLAFDLKKKEPVAIKEYFPNGLADRSMARDDRIHVLDGKMRTYYEKGLSDFEKEARILAKLQGIKGIVQVEGFFRENNTAYMVMEYVQGISLKEYLIKEGKPLTEERCLLLMQPVIRALSCVHKEGIIHRDISPDNIIVKEDGSVVLIDFGSARLALGDETKSLTVLLKHGYAPVEQYQTRGKQGPWTDIYALCATMYRMVSGRVPNESIERLVDDELTPLREITYKDNLLKVSKKFSDVIEKGMAIRNDERYQNMEILLQELWDWRQCKDEIEDSMINRIDKYDYETRVIDNEKNDNAPLRNIEKYIIILLLLILLIATIFLNDDQYIRMNVDDDKIIERVNKDDVINIEEYMDKNVEELIEDIQKFYPDSNIQTLEQDYCMVDGQLEIDASHGKIAHVLLGPGKQFPLICILGYNVTDHFESVYELEQSIRELGIEIVDATVTINGEEFSAKVIDYDIKTQKCMLYIIYNIDSEGEIDIYMMDFYSKE